MIRQELDAAVDRQLPTLRVISAALAVSVIVHAAIAWWVVAAFFREPLVELPQPVIVVVVASGLLLILLGYLVSRSIRNGQRSTAPVSGGRGFDALLQTYTRSVIVAAAFREAASVIGMSLSILTSELLWVATLSTATLISMTVHWPRRAALTDWLLQQRDAW